MTTQNFEYIGAATKIVFGSDSILKLPEILEDFPESRILVICSKSVARSELSNRIKTILGERMVGLFSDIASHSSVETVIRGTEIARELKANIFVTVGGGSISDTAKAMSILVTTGGTLEEFAFFKKLPSQQIPIIAIPTTASAAEMTPGAGIRNHDGRKLIFWDEKLVSRVVILDPNILKTVPKPIIATTSMNALAHSIEGLYSKQKNPISSALATQSILYLMKGIELLAEEGQIEEACSNILIGSNMSGIVISNARVALHHGICHCIARFDISHGVANTIMLPHVLRFNLSAASSELAFIANSLNLNQDHSKSEEQLGILLVQYIEELNRKLNNPVRLRDVGVPQEGLESIANDTRLERAIRSNPIPVEKEDVMRILTNAW